MRKKPDGWLRSRPDRLKKIDQDDSQPRRRICAECSSSAWERSGNLSDAVGIGAGDLAQQHESTDEKANELDLRHDPLSRSFVCVAGFAEQ
jgi:hypothetical protein